VISQIIFKFVLLNYKIMAQVTLNKNSWHFNYYSLIVSDTPPKSLCPYFWTMVLILLLSPAIGMFYLVSFIMKNVTKFFDSIVPKKEEKQKTWEDIEKEWEERKLRKIKKEQFWSKVTDKFVWLMKYILLPSIVIGLVYFVYKAGVEEGWMVLLIKTGIALLFVIFIIGVVVLIEKFGGVFGKFILKCLKPFNVFNWKVTKICGEMIKVAYTKACPLITWEGETKEQFLND